jgi:2-methylisocitrate lyase-like PEP mutase family enzyme
LKNSGLGPLLMPSRTLLAPGIYDPLSALLASQAGFESLYLSGASVAYTQLGRSDVGLVSLDNLLDIVLRISDRVDLPLIVDADTGFGNALNAQRTVRLLERAGAAAIQLEDQSFPKRCGHLTGKSLVPTSDMVGKVHAAVDARESRGTLIIARTDAIAVEGLGRAIERAGAYRAAGADVLFVEAPRSLAEMRSLAAAFDDTPLMANMVEGGDTPMLDLNELQTLGFSLAISPGAFVRALIPMGQAFFASLREAGSTLPFRNRMTDLRGVNECIGTAELLAQGSLYDPAIEAAFSP